MTNPTQSTGGVELPDFLSHTDVARIRRRVYGGPRFDTLERQWAAEIEHAVRERFIAALASARESEDGAYALIREIVASQDARFPPREEGVPAQDDWATRRVKALKAAREALAAHEAKSGRVG